MLKNITLSAEESDIAAAREWAEKEAHTTLNALFREWIRQCALRRLQGEAREREEAARAYDEFMKRIGPVSLGPMPSREERNARK